MELHSVVNSSPAFSRRILGLSTFTSNASSDCGKYMFGGLLFKQETCKSSSILAGSQLPLQRFESQCRREFVWKNSLADHNGDVPGFVSRRLKAAASAHLHSIVRFELYCFTGCPSEAKLERDRHKLRDCMSCRWSELPFRTPSWVLGINRRRFSSSSSSRVICNVSMISPELTAAFSSSQNHLLHDLAMGAVTTVAALASLRFWDELAKRDVFDKKVSRKLVHISIGLIFMLFWPLFSNGPVAPYIAAFSPGVNGLRMLAIGFGIMKNDAVVKAMSRYGDPRELLKGPFYYATAITLATICFWRTSPLAPIIITSLCAGDGFADLIGRRFGSAKLPYNSNKSYVGSFVMLTLGFLFSIGYEYYLSSFGFYEMSLKLVIGTLIVSLAATIVESLPISTKLDDNLTVPFTSFVIGSFVI